MMVAVASAPAQPEAVTAPCESCERSRPLALVTFGRWPNLAPFLVCSGCARLAVDVGIGQRVPVLVESAG